MNAARRLPLRWTAAWLFMLCAAAVSAQTQTPQQIAKKALASTVLVVAGNAEGETVGVGSGFFVRSGLIATNRHVIDEASVIRVRLVNQEQFHRIDSVAAQDAELDLALLRVSSLSAPALPLGDSGKLQIGEPIYAVGNPIGFLEGTFSDGLVSGIRALDSLKLIQMTAPISEGSSGGPVLNGKGEVIGVSTAGIELGQNLNFAVPSNALKTMMGRIGRPNLVVPTPHPKPTFPPPRPQPAAAPERFADYMKWSLPKGAKARLGKGQIFAIMYSPDGSTLAVRSSVGIWIYDVRSDRLIALLEGTQGTRQYFSFAYSPDGQYIAHTDSDISDNKIWIRNAQTGALLQTLESDSLNGQIECVTYSPDGQCIAGGSVLTSKIWIWNTQTGARLQTLLTGEKGIISSVAYSPDGQTIIASAGHPGPSAIWIWNAQTGALLQTIESEGKIGSVKYSPDRQYIASSPIKFFSSNANIQIWDANTGGLLRTFEGSEFAAYSPDGQNIAIESTDPRVSGIEIRNAGTGALLRTLEGLTKLIEYSPDGQTIASVSIGNTIQIWDVRTGALIKTLHMGYMEDFRFVAYSPDGQTIASVSRFNKIRIWNARTGALIRTLKGNYLSVAYSPDGQTIASVSSMDNTIQIWDVRTGALLKILNTKYIFGISDCLAYSPDGQTIAIEIGETIQIWDVRTGARIRTFRGPASISSVAYSPDGQTIASSNDDGTIRIWNIRTGALLKTLTGHTHNVFSVAYSPDGQTIASKGWSKGWDDYLSISVWEDYMIQIWNVRTGALLKTFEMPRYSSMAYAYSPNSRNIASAGEGDGTIQIRNARTGALIRTLKGHHVGRVASVAYSPDGRTLASASDDGTILLWDVSNQ